MPAVRRLISKTSKLIFKYRDKVRVSLMPHSPNGIIITVFVIKILFSSDDNVYKYADF